jgi:predicted site-specific integrase-resolvase
MAAADGVDLQTAARFCKVPYKTLARWSLNWKPVGKRGGRWLFDAEAVFAAVAARQERDAA